MCSGDKRQENTKQGRHISSIVSVAKTGPVRCMNNWGLCQVNCVLSCKVGDVGRDKKHFWKSTWIFSHSQQSISLQSIVTVTLLINTHWLYRTGKLTLLIQVWSHYYSLTREWETVTPPLQVWLHNTIGKQGNGD